MDTSVRSGDLCVFKRVDRKKPKYLLGRVVQFSYLSGSKRDRQYTSTYVDMTKENFKTIGAFAILIYRSLFRIIPRGPSSSFYAVRKPFFYRVFADGPVRELDQR